jgi:hypothetical protein
MVIKTYVLTWWALFGLSFANLAQTGAETPATTTTATEVSGRIVDAKGTPIQFGALRLVPLDPRDRGVRWASALGSDGSFSLYNVQAKQYRLSYWEDELFNVMPAQITIAPGNRIEIGEVTVRNNVRSNIAMNHIAVDPMASAATSPSLEPFSKNLSAGSNCHLQLNLPTSVQRFLGGKVKSIRVLRALQMRGAGALGSSEVQTRVLQTWRGIIVEGSCAIDWAEANFWDVEASVEYEDGKRTAMIFDRSHHLALEDRDGQTWFIRLWPYD